MHGSHRRTADLLTASTDGGGLRIQEGDARSTRSINGIKASDAWKAGRNVIILVWDENDYTNAQPRGDAGRDRATPRTAASSANAYDHFSLLRTLEAGFGLPCLNHACDSTSLIMNDMFGN